MHLIWCGFYYLLFDYFYMYSSVVLPVTATSGPVTLEENPTQDNNSKSM